MNSLPTIGSYGEYKTHNYGVNCQYMDLGPLTLYFSYKTIVAFTHNGVRTVCENCWGNTTGKHLNWLDGRDHKNRLSRDEFNKKLDEVLLQHINGRNIKPLLYST